MSFIQRCLNYVFLSAKVVRHNEYVALNFLIPGLVRLPVYFTPSRAQAEYLTSNREFMQSLD